MNRLIPPALQVLLNIINFILFMTLYSHLKGTDYFENKIRDFILMGSYSIITLLMNFFSVLYRRPIRVNLQLINKITQKHECHYVLNQTNMDLRTIIVKLNTDRKIGLNKFVKWYLRNKKISILIRCNPPELQLQVNDEMLLPNIKPLNDGTGFMIDVTNYFMEILNYNNPANFSKEYRFFIRDPRNVNKYELYDTSVHINPIIVLNENQDKRLKFFEYLINWSSSGYKIDYFRDEVSDNVFKENIRANSRAR